MRDQFTAGYWVGAGVGFAAGVLWTGYAVWYSRRCQRRAFVEDVEAMAEWAGGAR